MGWGIFSLDVELVFVPSSLTRGGLAEVRTGGQLNNTATCQCNVSVTNFGLL